jgi:hypothetical protein
MVENSIQQQTTFIKPGSAGQITAAAVLDKPEGHPYNHFVPAQALIWWD